jgi:hypothetical protein
VMVSTADACTTACQVARQPVKWYDSLSSGTTACQVARQPVKWHDSLSSGTGSCHWKPFESN